MLLLLKDKATKGGKRGVLGGASYQPCFIKGRFTTLCVTARLKTESRNSKIKEALNHVVRNNEAEKEGPASEEGGKLYIGIKGDFIYEEI